MTTEKAVKKILSGIGSAAEHRRRADTISALYYKELAHISLSELRDPPAVFSCSTDRDDEAIAKLLSIPGKICTPGITGALFSKYCSELCAANGTAPALADMFPHTENAMPTAAAYVTGGSADPAFQAFRDEYARITGGELRPHHAEHVSAACDCVLDGVTDFAVIPVWNDKDGRLRSFYRMINEFDMKIVSVVTVPTTAGRTRFALCGADAAPFCDFPLCMEFSVHEQDSRAADIIEAVHAHGHTVEEVAALPADNDRVHLYFTVRAGGDLRPTLLYLNLFHPSHTILGLYGSINK